MKTLILNHKQVVLILVVILLTLGTSVISYGQVCNVGDVLSPGESCTYPGTDATFSVLDNGNARWNIPGFPLFNKVSIAGSLNFTATINGKRYHFVATARSGNSWVIDELGDRVNTVDDPPRDRESQPDGITASTAAPLTEATLNESVVTLTLIGGTFEESIFKIKDAVTVSGISGVTVGTFDIDRLSDTQITLELTFDGTDFDTTSTLTFTVGSGAIANYSGSGFTAQVPVASGSESLVASTAAPLTEATLNESVVTLTLSGRTFERSIFKVRDAVTVSGISGVTVGTFDIDRVSDTVVTVELTFGGNINTNSTLTFTVGAGAIANYSGSAFIAQIPVAAGDESNETEEPPPDTTTTNQPEQPISDGQTPILTASPHRARADFNGSVVTLTLSDGTYARSISDISGAVTVAGISGVTVPGHGTDRESNTEITVEVRFTGYLDTNAILTFIVGAEAIANYNGPALTAQIPVVTLIAQEIRGSWLWMAVPTDLTAGSNTSTEIDSLAATSGGAVTETHVAQNSVNEGNTVGHRQWSSRDIQTEPACVKYDISWCADPTVCWENNINEVVNALGMGTGRNMKAHTGYALINIISPREQREVILNVNSDDTIKVWLNGNVIHRDAAKSIGCRRIDVRFACDPWVCVSDPLLQESDTSTIPITLRAGNNLLLVKVQQHGEYWGMNVALAADFTTAIPTAQTEVNVPPPSTSETLEGDANNDGVVNIQDLVLVASNYGQTGQNAGDVNGDRVVNSADLLVVASALDNAAAAPLAQPETLEMFAAADVKLWLSHARQLDLTNVKFLRGIRFLEQLLAALIPRETTLLPNYPNPFNPETWIPYRLAEDAFVALTIYDRSGRVVRSLDVGHRIAAVYESRSKAIYWDGRNGLGEQVASGVYFYHLSAGDYSATRKMLTLK